MINGKLSTINTPAQRINNAGAGYLSGTDPVGAFIVGNVVAGKPLAWLGKGLEYGAAKAGSQWARNRIVGREVKKRVSHLVPSNGTVPSNRISLPSNSPISTHRVFEGKNIFPSKTGDIPTYGNQSYRLTRTDQLKDIFETGYVRPRAGKVKGGHEGEVFWSQGNKDFTYKPKDVILETKPNTLPIGNSTNRVGINDLNKIYVNGTNILDGKIHPYKKGGIIKYQEPTNGIQRKSNSAIRTETDKNVPKYNRAVYSSVNPTWGVPNNVIQAGRLSTQARIKSWKDDQDNMEYSVGTQVGDSVVDAAWRKRLGLSYDNKFLPKFNGDTVRLPKQLEMEIPTDTNMLKKRIARTEKLIRQSSKYRNSEVIDIALKSDQRALDALRKTYKTGNPVGIDEYSNNSRKLVDNGIINENYISPLNIFRNYNIRYDRPTNQMYYSKSYDFDTKEHNWDKFVPGNKFYIRGSIDLNKKK